MNKKKILISLFTVIISITLFLLPIKANAYANVGETTSLRTIVKNVRLFDEQFNLVYGGTSDSVNTFNSLCIDYNSLHTFVITDKYYNLVKSYVGNDLLQQEYIFNLELKDLVLCDDYSFVFNAIYNTAPRNIYVAINYDDNTTSYHDINVSYKETTFIFDYNYFRTNVKLGKNIKSISFAAPYITSIDIFSNNNENSYNIGFLNGQNSVILSPNNYNLYSQNQYNNEYNNGYNDGLSVNTDTSYNSGYSSGYTIGYNDGYDSATVYGVNKVINFNQLMKINDLNSSTTVGGIIRTNNNNGSFSLSGTSQDTPSTYVYLYSKNVNTGIQLDTSHKYILYTPTNLSNYIRGTYIDTNNTNRYITDYNGIFTNAIALTQVFFNIPNGVNVDNSYIWLNVIDLTQIYGVDNEPSTYQEFNLDFQSLYYSYTTSDLVNYDYLNGYNKGIQDMNVVVRDKQELLNKAINGDLTFTNMFTSIFDVPVQTITNMLNFNFLGVNLLDFFLSIFTICIIIAILKLIL